MSSCLVARHRALRTIFSPRDLRLSSEVSVAHDAWCTRKPSRSFVDARRRNAVGHFRAHSSNAEASKDSFTTDASSRRLEVSALLHRISAFLPRALSASTSDGGIQSAQLWGELLSEIDACLSSPSVSDEPQSARVVGESFSRLSMLMNSTKFFSLRGRPVGWLPEACHSSSRKPIYV
jgi:hypothetical protein